MNSAAIILPPMPTIGTGDHDANGITPPKNVYQINALCHSSKYFESMFCGRWAEAEASSSRSSKKRRKTSNSISDYYRAVIDLSKTDLDPMACASVLRFMVARYEEHESSSYGDGSLGSNDDPVPVDCHPPTTNLSCSTALHRVGIVSPEKEEQPQKTPVSLKQMNLLLWDGFQWDEDSIDIGHYEYNEEQQQQQQQSSISSERRLSQAIAYFQLQPHDEIQTKLWSMKMIQRPLLLEETLQEQKWIVERMFTGDRGCIRAFPKDKIWRFFMCLFVCNMLTDHMSNDGTLSKYRIEDCIDHLCYNLNNNESTPAFRKEMMDFGLITKGNIVNSSEAKYTRASVDIQIELLFSMLDENGGADQYP